MKERIITKLSGDKIINKNINQSKFPVSVWPNAVSWIYMQSRMPDSRSSIGFSDKCHVLRLATDGNNCRVLFLYYVPIRSQVKFRQMHILRYEQVNIIGMSKPRSLNNVLQVWNMIRGSVIITDRKELPVILWYTGENFLFFFPFFLYVLTSLEDTRRGSVEQSLQALFRACAVMYTVVFWTFPPHDPCFSSYFF